MLREWLISLRTRCPKGLVALGYRYAAVACLSRAERCAAAWAPHQRRTRAAIISAMADVPPDRDTALILGAGPCLDLPMAELLARFARLLLVDVAHPPPARRLAARHAGIELVTQELTGMADVWKAAEGGTKAAPPITAFWDDPRIGLVVSANLVSQLPLVPLRQTLRHRPETNSVALGRAIVEAHLAHLRGFACPTLLIGDIARHVLNDQGVVVEVEDPLFGASLPAGSEWDWTVAPVGEIADRWSIINRVRAVRLDGRRFS
ncbi:hypothetical protein GE253_20810 [Niveispirillum sp. SYP-B3756]|uniref:hypothetical protein n=1 Tax=Niveispirillum sp. SYP-B3756 TaxID=2662178 RepID=UPI001290B73B|nr:hypothetical protein [Niveispirillum sp. SYP-B3756]MQP67772.1 hypothetical protein [Niveispirillum sp. SYP-B3756]